MNTTFWGYERAAGLPGIRNAVAIVSVMDNTNQIAQIIAQHVDGSVLLTDLYGRKMLGYNFEMMQKAMVGMCTNPNVGAVLIVSLHRPSALAFAEGIAASGVEVECLVYQEHANAMRCVEVGVNTAVQMTKRCSMARRREFPLSQLVLGVECGGSDHSSGLAGNPSLGYAADRLMEAGGTVVLSETAEIMGAEHILARNAASPEVGHAVYEAVAAIEEMARFAGVPDIRRGNPSADNINAGLTTLAEKSLGAIRKGGTKPLIGVLDYCDHIPAENPGYYFMHTPSPACESMTGFAAGGAQIIAFNTGLGNPTANPVTPTIKMTGNPVTVARSMADFDVEVSDVLTGGTSLAEAGQRVYEEIVQVANGKKTATEVVRMFQSTIGRQGSSY